MNGPSNTFCSVPWTQLATNASGYFRVCCNALPGQNLVRDTDGKPMHISSAAIEDVWQAPTYQKIRAELLAGQRPEMCTRCFREEDSQVESARQRWNKRWPFEPQFEQETQGAPVRYFDLRLGNQCNLRCRMCNPYASDKWVEEWNQVVGTAVLAPSSPLSEEEKLRLQKMDWPKDPEVWRKLGPFLRGIEEIYLTGGEPFLSLEQVHLLRELVETGQASQVVLKYNTNLTAIPPRLLELWPKFKQVRLNVSLDGEGDLLNYIRYPADWSVVAGNLDRLMSLQSQHPNYEVGVHITVQMYNIIRLADFVRLIQTRWGLRPYLNILNHPHCLNIRALPESLKAKVSEQLQEASRSFKELRRVLDYLNAESWSGEHFQEFQTYTNKLDELRGQSFLSLAPEFSPFWSRGASIPPQRTEEKVWP